MIKNEIITERLKIRPLEKEDNIDWLEIFSSKNVGKFIHNLNDIKSVDKMIDKKIEKYKANRGQSFSIVEKISQKVIGNIELKFLEEENCVEISYVLNDKFWNNGYATESAKALIDFAFNVMHIKKIVADCIETNFSSCHILKEKLKMKQVGIEIRIDRLTNKTLNFVCFELENKT